MKRTALRVPGRHGPQVRALRAADGGAGRGSAVLHVQDPGDLAEGAGIQWVADWGGNGVQEFRRLLSRRSRAC